MLSVLDAINANVEISRALPRRRAPVAVAQSLGPASRQTGMIAVARKTTESACRFAILDNKRDGRSRTIFSRSPLASTPHLIVPGAV